MLFFAIFSKKKISNYSGFLKNITLIIGQINGGEGAPLLNVKNEKINKILRKGKRDIKLLNA